MTYEEAKAKRDKLDRRSIAADAVLRTFPRNATGLTPEYVRLTPEYRTAKAASLKAFDRLRTFNAWFVSTFKEEYRQDRKNRR